MSNTSAPTVTATLLLNNAGKGTFTRTTYSNSLPAIGSGCAGWGKTRNLELHQLWMEKFNGNLSLQNKNKKKKVTSILTVKRIFISMGKHTTICMALLHWEPPTPALTQLLHPWVSLSYENPTWAYTDSNFIYAKQRFLRPPGSAKSTGWMSKAIPTRICLCAHHGNANYTTTR